MTQACDDRVVDAFQALSAEHRRLLATELALTGCDGQFFSQCPDARGGPAILIYYGPALMQKNKEADPERLCATLLLLTEVLRVTRTLWPLQRELEGTNISVNIAELKTQSIDAVLEAATGDGCFVLVKHNEKEGSVKLVEAAALQDPEFHKGPFCKLDLSHCQSPMDDTSDDESDSEDDEDHLAHKHSHGQHREHLDRSSICTVLPELNDSDHASTMQSDLARLKQENWTLREQVAWQQQQLERLKMMTGTRLTRAGFEKIPSTAYTDSEDAVSV
jgi:hypothetical protein